MLMILKLDISHLGKCSCKYGESCVGYKYKAYNVFHMLCKRCIITAVSMIDNKCKVAFS